MKHITQTSPSRHDSLQTVVQFSLKTFSLLLLLLFIGQQTFVQAQCTSPENESSYSCSGGNGALTSNASVNSGTTYWYTSTGTVSNISMNGGTLVVCGDLTLSGGNYNGGKIIIKTGGILRTNMTNFNIAIHNFGTLNITGSMTIGGSGKIINVSGATVNTTGNYTLTCEGQFVNYGTANVYAISAQNSSNRVCMGAGATVNATNLSATTGNTWDAPSGSACVKYSGSASISNGNFTANANLLVCRQSGATVSGNWGSATVSYPCSSCCTATANAGTDVSVCNGSSTTLTAMGGETYAWSNGTTTATNPVTPTSTTTYTVTVTANGCSASDAVVVTVNALPTANAGNDVTICAGTSATLTGQGGSSYLWSNSSATAQISVSPTETTTYTLTTTASNGCTDDDQVVVTVNDNISVDAGSNQSICTGTSTTLSAQGGDSYLWSNGATTAIITVTPSSNSTYTVTVTSNTCTGSDQVEVSLLADPTADAGTDVEINTGYSANLLASGGVSYSWSSGATSASTLVSPTSNSTYTVTVTDANGCTASDNVAVAVTPLNASGCSLPILESNYSCTGGNGAVTNGMSINQGNYWYNGNGSLSSITLGGGVFVVCGNLTIGSIAFNGGLMVVKPGSTVTIVSSIINSDIYNFGTLVINNTAILHGGRTLLNGPNATINMNAGSYQLQVDGNVINYGTINVYSIKSQGLVCCNSNSRINATNIETTAGQTFSATGNTSCVSYTGSAVISNGVFTSSNLIQVCKGANATASGSWGNAIVTENCSSCNTIAGGAGNDQQICAGESAQLNAYGGNSYSWSTGATTSSITLTPAQTTTYTVTVTSESQTVTDEVVVTVNAIPTVNISGNNTICSGQSTTLTATTTGTVLWNNGATEQNITVSPIQATTYSLTATQNGCSATSNITITVNATPTVTLSDDQTICAGASVSLTATGGNSYQWSTTGTTDIIVVTPAESSTYTVTAVTNGCTASSDVTIQVNETPTVNLGSDLTICIGNQVSITAEGNGDFRWENEETINIRTIAPNSTTTYTVTITDNVNLCTNSDEVVVTVNNFPTIYVGEDIIKCDALSTIELTAVGNSTQLVWNTGDTTTSITVSPTYTTSYIVTATLNNCSASDFIVIDVRDKPEISLSESTTICVGETAVLTVSGGESYLWSNNEVDYQIDVTPITTTTYSVTATANECTASEEVIVIVNAFPEPGLDNQYVVCQGSTIQITAQGGDSYTWNTNATTATINISPTTDEHYTVTVSNGGCSSTDATVIIVDPSINLENNQTICTGASTTLTASLNGDYNWSTGSTLSSITVTPEETSVYSITFTSINNCVSSDEIQIDITSLPVADAGEDMLVCAGSAFSLTASGGAHYLWNTNNTTATPQLTTNHETTYTVTVTDNNGCTASDEVIVAVNPSPTVTISSDKNVGFNGESVVYTANGNGTYLWNTNETTNSITAVLNGTGKYTVTVTGANGCTTSNQQQVGVYINSMSEFNGDAEGTLDNILITGIQGRAISDSLPKDGSIIMWDSITNKWIPTTQLKTIRVKDELAVGDSTLMFSSKQGEVSGLIENIIYAHSGNIQLQCNSTYFDLKELRFKPINANGHTFINSGTSYGATIGNTGKVGIGFNSTVTSPMTKLHVKVDQFGGSPWDANIKNGIAIGSNNGNCVLNMGTDENTPRLNSWIQSRDQNSTTGRPLFLNPIGGNVVIGNTTATPTEKLVVAGGGVFIDRKTKFSTVEGDADNDWVRDTWLTMSRDADLRWDRSLKKWIRTEQQINDVGGVVWSNSGAHFLYISSVNTVNEWNNADFIKQSFLSVEKTSGNVTMGTNKLVIQAKTGADNELLLASDLTNSNRISFKYGADINWQISSNFPINDPGIKGFAIRNKKLNFTAFYVDASNHVMIGQAYEYEPSYGYLLSVNGKIRTKGVHIDLSSWPDYVFDNTYKLTPLKDVEQFIKENKHLPGIPSAQKVIKDGVDIGEINHKLLQKIEELTLYIIELEKRINTIENK